MIMLCWKKKKKLDKGVSYTHHTRDCSGNGRNLKGQEQPAYISHHSSGRNQDPLQGEKQREEEGFLNI